MKKLQLSTPLLPREVTWGTGYLLFSLFFSGVLIKLLLSWLWPDYPRVWLDTIYYGLNLAVGILIFHHFLAESLRHILKQLPMIVLVSVIALVVYFAVVPPLDTAIDALKPGAINQNNEYIVQKAAVNPWLNAFGIIALVPTSEEILYRGLVFGGIRKKSRILAYVVSILLFAAIHVVPYWNLYTPSLFMLFFAAYLPAGLILALSYEISDSIFAPILIHTVINTIAILI